MKAVDISRFEKVHDRHREMFQRVSELDALCFDDSDFEKLSEATNTKWLEFRDAAEECLTRYKGDDKKTVEMLVRLFGDLCVQIAAYTSYWDSKRGMLLAKEATRITMELQRRGFMEKSREVSDANE